MAAFTVLIFSVLAAGLVYQTQRSANAGTTNVADTGTASAKAALPAALSSGDVSLPSCPAMTGGKDAKVSSSCQIDQDIDAGNVSIEGGALVTVADKDLKFRVRSFVAMGAGTKFIAGCPGGRTSTLTITITETDRTADVMGMGAGPVGAMDGADFCLMGSYQGHGFTQPTKTVAAGATTMSTVEALGVAKGDSLLFATTNRESDGNDTATVTDVSADGKTVSFSPAVKSEHTCESKTYEGDKTIQMCGDVATLSRNVNITTAAGALGHVMFMGNGTAQVAGVHLSKLGYEQRARYAIHMHRKGDSPTSFFARNSCTDALSRCYVIHATDNAFLRDNVGYNSACSMYLMGETGNEVGNDFRHNLGVGAHACGIEDFDSLPKGPSVMWTPAVNNTFVDNHAADSGNWGFQIDVRRFLANRDTAPGTTTNPSKNTVGVFDGLTAYSIRNSNVRCGPDACGAALNIDVDGSDNNGCFPDQQNKNWKCHKLTERIDGQNEADAFPGYDFGHKILLHNVTAWNAEHCVWGFRGFAIKGLRCSDTTDGLWLQDGIVQDGLVVARSGIAQNPPHSLQCTRMYDFKTVVVDTTFVNCGTGDSEGGAIDVNGSFDDSTSSDYGANVFKNVRFQNSVPIRIDEGESGDKCDRQNGFITWLIGDNDGLGSGWVAYKCSPFAGDTQPNSNDAKIVRTAPPAFFTSGEYQHVDPNKVGIPDLADAPARTVPALPVALSASASGSDSGTTVTAPPSPATTTPGASASPTATGSSGATGEPTATVSSDPTATAPTATAPTATAPTATDPTATAPAPSATPVPSATAGRPSATPSRTTKPRHRPRPTRSHR